MKKNIFLLAVMTVLPLLFLACNSTAVRKESAAAQPEATDSRATDSRATESRAMVNQYHEFSDVLIPGELTAKPKRSYVYRTPGFAAGLLVFQGRIDATSLSSFFESNMARDNWRYTSAFKHNPMIMIFEKDNRACVIRIEETLFVTLVEVWMAPTLKERMPAVF